MLMSNIVLLKAGDGHKLPALFLFENKKKTKITLLHKLKPAYLMFHTIRNHHGCVRYLCVELNANIN